MTDKLQDLFDRDEIEQLLIRYCNANDSDDWDGMASVFTEEQRTERAERYSKIRTLATTLMPIEKIKVEQHMLSNIEIKVDGDTATAFSACRVYIVGTRGDEPVMLIRGITYTDELVRTAEGWRIKERVHYLVWMTETKPIEGKQAH